MREIKWRKKIRQTNSTSHRRCNHYILGYSDAVMIIDEALTEHFGIHRRCSATASAHRRCNRISPTLCCLLTQPVRMASKSTTDAENIYASLVMGSIGAQYPYGSIDTTFDPPQFSLDSTFNYHCIAA